ncbi:MAG: division/cell wall cluster transcriptional repressor MraZ [Eubacteriales bacterium]|nr:division/cell wall cluster transcriptional repressor MraZ [Eubacteriales bacterium]
MAVFKGQYEHSLDPKGRIAIPAKFREGLGDEFVVWNWFFDPCLYVQSNGEYENIARQLDDMSFADEDAAMLRRALFARAFDVELDKQGRILLPASQREYAKLDKDAVILGVGNHVEIWSRQVWQDKAQTLDTDMLRQAVRNLRAQGLHI